MTRFIHTSDWQLGMTRWFLNDEDGARFSQDRIDAIGRLGEAAKDRGAQFIVVAGDVFESNQVSQQTLLRALEALKKLPVPIFLLPGNHDPLDAASIFATRPFRDAGDHVVVLRDMQPVAVPNCPAVELVAAPWRSKRPTSDLCADLVASLEPAAEGVLRIAVAHGQVDTLAPDTSRPDIIDLACAEQAIADRKFDYLALGDRHSLTRIGETGRIWYSGAPVATAFDENNPNKALLVDLEVNGDCKVEELPIGNWTFIADAFAMNGPEDLANFGNWLEEIPNKHCTAVKVGFRGSINLQTAAQLDELMASQAELFASLRRRERTSDLVIVPDAFDQDNVALSGYARQTWDELLQLAQRDNIIAQDALRLFYRLSAEASD